MRRICFLQRFLSRCASSRWRSSRRQPKAATGPSDFKIGGAVTTPFAVTVEDLKKMPRKTLRVENAHTKKTEVYEGVPLEDLLQKAGVPQGEQLRGPAMATYVLVEAADNYRVLFSLAELDLRISGLGSSCWRTRWMARRWLPIRARSSLLPLTKSARRAGWRWSSRSPLGECRISSTDFSLFDFDFACTAPASRKQAEACATHRS